MRLSWVVRSSFSRCAISWRLSSGVRALASSIICSSVWLDIVAPVRYRPLFNRLYYLPSTSAGQNRCIFCLCVQEHLADGRLSGQGGGVSGQGSVVGGRGAGAVGGGVGLVVSGEELGVKGRAIVLRRRWSGGA